MHSTCLSWHWRFKNKPTRNVYWKDQRNAKEASRTIAEFVEDFPNVANLFAEAFLELVKHISRFVQNLLTKKSQIKLLEIKETIVTIMIMTQWRGLQTWFWSVWTVLSWEMKSKNENFDDDVHINIAMKKAQ